MMTPKQRDQQAKGAPCGGASGEDGEVSRDHGEDFGLFLKSNRKPLKSLTQGRGMIRFVFKESHHCYKAENGFHGGSAVEGEK